MQSEVECADRDDSEALASSYFARLGAIAIIAVVVAQVAVPLSALLLPPPQRFGFQMYSGYGGVTAIVRDSSGSEFVIDDLTDVVANLRTDINWLDVLPEAICAARPTVVEVAVEQSGRSRTITCG